MKIAVLESLGISAEAMAEREKPFQEAGHVFVHYDKTTDTEKLKEEVRDADALILANMPLPGEVIAAGEKLSFIDIAFTGVDHVGMDVVRERGITASNASGYSTEAVAELSLGMAIDILRNVRAVETRARTGGTKDGLVGTEIRGKTVGIVGLGAIGSRTAEIYHALGAKILATSRTVHENAPDYVTQVSLDELLSASDIVSLHCPLNDSTRGLIDEEKLSLMKPGAILLNLARGPVVKSQALADALNAGKIAGAGIDVFDTEPPIPETDPLLGAKNTLLTPHIAFASKESMILRADIVFENLKAFLEGSPVHVVR